MFKCVFTIIFIITSIFGYQFSYADTASDLQNKIEDKSKQIEQIESEIKIYTGEANKISQQSNTLQNTIKSLDISDKKITANLNLTSEKINKTTLTIEQLNNGIYETGIKISKNKEIVAEMLRNIDEVENVDIITIILSGSNIKDVWEDLDSVKKIQYEIRKQSEELSKTKSEMEEKNLNLQGQKKQLSNLKVDLSGQKEAVIENKKEKSTLLSQTKNQEKIYKELIAQKEAEKDSFEKELFDYESQLKIFIDPTGYPNPKLGLLSWPLENVYITQRFGKTVGAEKLYVSGSHNGVDFRASVGTKVMSVLDGVVLDTGNTDAFKGCYSFGKWVMVKHPNGLSTIYAHLSVISVSPGQQVATGDTLGFSGNTGYSTGPHLHLGLYATQGVIIKKHSTSMGCKEATMPIADIKAYLDPIPYLPKI
ncbi:MAG: peptidoglycan DD-metalloendopeptidase family protein [Candidatus Paceibacterota bacterium]